MFGIGNLVDKILADHNLADIASRLNLDSVDGLRASLDSAEKEGLISNMGGLLGDLSTQLKDMMGNLSESIGDLLDPDSDEAAAQAEAAATGAMDADLTTVEAHAEPQPARSEAWLMEPEPGAAEIVPHEAAHTLQGTGQADGAAVVEAASAIPADGGDDDTPLIATEAELQTASPAALTQTAEPEQVDND